MKNQTKSFFIALGILGGLFGCSKSSSEKEMIACTAQIQPAFIIFNIVEAGTGEDLFL